MPVEPRERPHEQWHAALRAKDAHAHGAEDAWMAENAVAALEGRLAQANGERRILTEAVLVRDGIIAVLGHALTERDALLAGLEQDLRTLRELAAQPLHRRVLRAVRREVSGWLGR